MLIHHQKRTLLLILTLAGTLWFAQSLFAQQQPLPQIPLNQVPATAFTLTRTSPDKLEQALRQICGHRVAVETPYQYVLTTNHNKVRRQCSLRLEPQSKQVFISGDKQLCDQAFQLLTAIDQHVPTGSRTRTIITYEPHVLPEVLAQAFESYRTPAPSVAPKPHSETAAKYSKFNPEQNSKSIQQVQYRFQEGNFDGAADQTMPLQGSMQGGGGAISGFPQFGDPQFGNPPFVNISPVGIPEDFKYWFIPDLDLVVVDADGARLKKFTEMIKQIEAISKLNRPKIEIVHLKHVNNLALSDIINRNNQEVFNAIQRTIPGKVSVISMVTPNAMMLLGWGDAFDMAKELIESLDKPTVAENSQLQIFRLKHISATQAKNVLQGQQGPFLARVMDGSGFMARISLFVDARTNSLIVHGAPNDLEEFKRILDQIDVSESPTALQQIKTRKLKNSLASDLEPTLTKALSGTTDVKSPAFELLIQGEQGQRLIKSGILSDVTITPDIRNNTLIIRAPESCIPFIDELITLLDASAPEAEIKIFDIERASAESLVEMLQVLIPSNLDGTPGAQLPTSAGEDALIPIKLAVDKRTNCIVAAGSRKDLEIIEALVQRLDREDLQTRKTQVFPLINMKAVSYEMTEDGKVVIGTDGKPVIGGVAATINEYIRSRREIQKATPGVINSYQQIESEVIVIPDMQTNSLIINATPRYFEEITKLITEIDQSPPQVIIQVLIAEVTLSEDKEWAAELGFQDPLLFLRGGSKIPGLNFNTLDPKVPLGNEPINTGTVGTQLLSNFGAGRSGGGGGMVFSANSDFVNIMIRALHEKNRLEVLSSPKITTINNQQSTISVGQKVPRLKGSQSGYGVIEPKIEDEDVNMMLMVTPTISPDNKIMMKIFLTKDKIGANITVGNQTSSAIDTAMLRTMVNTANNQTVVLGGMITKEDNKRLLKVPLLGDIPYLGNLFRHDIKKTSRKELLVILTPRIIKNGEDIDQVNQIETARMSWCLNHVVETYGDIGAYNVVGERPYTGNAPVIIPGPVKTETLQPIESQYVAPVLPKKN